MRRFFSPEPHGPAFVIGSRTHLASLASVATAVAGFINGIAPGTVVIPSAVKVRVTSEASSDVTSV